MSGTSERPSREGPSEPELLDPKVPGSAGTPEPATAGHPVRGSLRRGQWTAPSTGPGEPEETPAAAEPQEAPGPRRGVPMAAVLAAVGVLVLGLGTAVAVQVHGHGHGHDTSAADGKRAGTAATGSAPARRKVAASLPAASPSSTHRKAPAKAKTKANAAHQPAATAAAAAAAPVAPPPPTYGSPTVSPTPEKAGAPEKKTAATAVERLAVSDPGGRHICYRVYIAGKGWSSVACDGQMAGSPGAGKPITALDTAVYGTQGTAGDAYVYDPASTSGEGHFPVPWSSAADGADNYVGSTKKGAPHMLGFTINVDNGNDSICQTTYIHDSGWMGLVCDDPSTGYPFTYAGARDNNSWIEAVKLTL